MWCPEGYYSWNDVRDELHGTAERVLALVSFGGVPVKEDNGEFRLNNTVEFYLVENDFAEDYAQARMMVAITTTYLIANFLEMFPPVLANIEGGKISVDPTFLVHMDQFECCIFRWPVKTDPQWLSFFEFSKQGNFKPGQIFDRFAFIDWITGELLPKNGAQHYLENGLGFEAHDAQKIMEMASNLRGYIVCWAEYPDVEEYRKFLQCIEADEVFTSALNFAFGQLRDQQPSSRAPRGLGRPRQRDAAAQVYASLYPNGHELHGLTWKEVVRVIGEKIGRPVTISTLKRGIAETSR